MPAYQFSSITTFFSLQINELGVTLPADSKLAAVSSRVIVAKACALALDEPRVQSDVVRGLIAQATELLTLSTKASSARSKTAGAETTQASVTSPLFDALGEDLQAAIRALQVLLTEAEAVTLQLDLSTAPENVATALDRLCALRVITAEEEYFEFIQVHIPADKNPIACFSSSFERLLSLYFTFLFTNRARRP
jgi:hypothetical protein